MKGTRAVALVILVALCCVNARADSLFDDITLHPGGRFEHHFLAAEEWTPYPWNLASSGAANRSRLMLDCALLTPRFGELYLKGDATWESSRSAGGSRLFAFRQGDYRYARAGTGLTAAFRLFANERRFFTGAYLAPLLTDDHADDSGSNRGVRLDLRLRESFRLSTLFASLDERWDDARKITYVRSAYHNRALQFSLSGLYEIPGPDAALRQALLKSELACFYKRGTLMLSYQQSRFAENGFFLPRLSFRTDRFVGDNFSSILPDEGAFFAQCRLASLPLREWGTVTVIQDYFAVGERFVNDLGVRSGEKVGYLCSALFRAASVDLNGRMQAGRSVRSHRERETRERLEASVWGGLRSGVEVTLRGGTIRSTDEFTAVSRRTYVLGAMTFHAKRMRHGIHLLADNLDSPGSSRNLAWDSRVVLNSDFAVDWRFILSNAVRDPVYCRLEFRPSQRLYATLGYGRDYLGDTPFLLDDNDLALADTDPSRYTLSIRGDF